MALATVGEARSDAASEVGDPQFRLVALPRWTYFYNKVTHDLAIRLMCLETLAIFDVQAGDDLYLYPDDMVQMRGFAFTNQPSDDTTFDWKGEIFENEFRAKTTGGYPTGDPEFYYARKGSFFQLVPRPDTTYAGGGQIAYCRRPTRLSTAQVDQEVIGVSPFELPDWTYHHVVEGMAIQGLRARRFYQDARERETVWRTAEADLLLPFKDRSDDRHPNVADSSLADQWGGSE